MDNTNIQQDAPEHIYSTKEFAQLIGVTERTLIRWQKEGRIIPGRIAGTRRKYYTEKQYYEALGISKQK